MLSKSPESLLLEPPSLLKMQQSYSSAQVKL